MSRMLFPAVISGILLSLFRKRLTYTDAFAGIFFGAIVDILWMVFPGKPGIYELFPGFIAGLIAAVIGTPVSPKPSKEVEELYETALKIND